MRITINMKDPDCLYGPVQEAVDEELERTMPDLDFEERQLLSQNRQEKCREKLRTWFEFGEYLEVEFDLEAMIATVKQR